MADKKTQRDEGVLTQERPKTIKICPNSDPRPPAETPPQRRYEGPYELPMIADRESEERPKTTCRRTTGGTRPPTEARHHHIRPWIENIKESCHRQNMLPVNITCED